MRNSNSSPWHARVQSVCRFATIVLACAIASACMAAPKSKDALAQDKIGRPVLAASEAQSLQSGIMSLTDTSIQRIASELRLGQTGITPEERHADLNARLVLASALVSIAMEADPVDSLADLLTHTTLTADAQRNAAERQAVDSAAAGLLHALEQNEADAWRLAERWVNAPTRAAFRARILAWPGVRTSAVAVAFVRLSDIQRAGSTSVESGDGMFDALHSMTEQVDQTRLLAERSLFLTQRLPFLLRWQAEVYTANALATKEAQQTQAQIEQMSAIFAGLADQVSRERAATLDDLFGHISTERRATLDQVMQIVQQERQATLLETGAAIDAQRKALLKDVLELTNLAGETGSEWIGRSLLIGGALIVMLLFGLLGMLLLYRRLLPLVERRPAVSG